MTITLLNILLQVELTVSHHPADHEHEVVIMHPVRKNSEANSSSTSL